MGGVSEDVDIFGRERGDVECFGARFCKCAELVSIVVIVGKGAEFEEFLDAVMLQFEVGAPLEIAGEESDGEMGAFSELLQEVEDAGE